MAGAVELYQIYYAEEHLSHLYPWAIPYYNKSLTPFFENTVISERVSQCKTEKIGVFSWRLKEKLSKNIPVTENSRKITEEMINDDYDVLSLTVNSKKHEMLANAERWHPGFCDILRKIGAKIGQPIPREVKFPIYQNHFIAKTEIYQQYIKEFLDPAMKVMVWNKVLSDLCWKDSGYTKLSKQPLSKEAIDNLGVDYYPLHAFLCERFFSCWVSNKKLNIKYI